MGPGFAFPSTRNLRHRHDRLKALGIHHLGSRFEADIHPFFAAERPILGNRARIAREVFARAELRRVHENTHNECIATESCRPDERTVAVMQRAHRGNESDDDAVPAQSFAPGCHGADGANNLHGPGGWLHAGREP